MESAVLIWTGFGLLAFSAAIGIIILGLRRIVPTNEVHIVQSGRNTVSYGSDFENGNTYYSWPSWLPLIGITTTIMPVSVFKLELKAYDAYDIGRVPFEVDIVAFFRIGDPNTAAKRVSSFQELADQLLFVMRGALRTILASEDIDRIMVERATLGVAFTKEVDDQLKNWGVHSVKNIELMDIRDTQGNQVIHNIMEKKKSLIEAQSRTEVAKNMKDAKVAEIAANRDAIVEQQQAEEAVGLRTADKNQRVGIANEKSTQAIRDEQRTSKEKEMEVVSVGSVKQAEINKNVEIVKAEQVKQTTILLAEGALESKKNESEAIRLEGQAKADAEKALQLAPVQAQITLAQEIGANESYQAYLINIRQIEANQWVGTEQAKALTAADVKVIVNGGTPAAGVANVMDLFTPKGGTQLAGFIEAIGQSSEGQDIIKKFTGKKGA